MKRLPLCICVILANAAMAGEAAPAAGRSGDPWLEPLKPHRAGKSRFPSPQLWPAKPGEFEIPLSIDDASPSGGRRFVTTGVPLMVAQAKDPGELRLLAKDAGGATRAIPAQFRVLARWWRFDDSIRWVLVDFQADVPAGARAEFVLTNRKVEAPAPPAKLVVEQTDAAITIDTGPAKFEIDRKAFNLLSGVWLDANHDGTFADGERIVAGTSAGGGSTQDALGNTYLASSGTRSVEVVEAGPMRVRVRARGRHVNAEGKGCKPGMYGFDAIMDFHAGSADVFVDYVVGNNPPKSEGSPSIEDASVSLELAEPATSYRFLAGKEAPSGDLSGRASACLYQDSNGADSWAACPGFGNMSTKGYSYPSGTVTSFRG